MSGLVTFRLGSREYATPLSAVREVVRLQGLADMPGMEPPLAGVLDLRGTALPVLDLRIGAGPDDRGDVLVLERGDSVDGGTVGVAVDRVKAVVSRDELPAAGAATEDGVLPAYVVEVLRGSTGPVFLVDLEQMVAAARKGVPAAT
ncbi:MAG: chemotaxis protein CheW [Actinomycetota bacterium]|nr:chemotaxis protein CheW [Actinomycetota bacterium]